MEQQLNNVGGHSTSMANSMPAQNNDAAGVPQFGAPGISQPAHFSTQPPQTTGPMYAASTPQQDAPNADDNNNDVSNTTSPDVADDSDLIEKEWVEKAKNIVEKTRLDPFTQSLKLNQLKAEYLQKRYGKNVGLDGQEV